MCFRNKTRECHKHYRVRHECERFFKLIFVNLLIFQVEFAAPVGYKEPESWKKVEEDEVAMDPADLMPEPSGFVAFRGAGNRLDGKKRKDSTSNDTTPSKPVYVRGIPDYDYEIGTLRFIRRSTKPTRDSGSSNKFKAFSGTGFSIR